MTSLLDDQPRSVCTLASLASLATRIEPVVLRALRLELARDLGAETEGDLWFSPLVEARGADGIVLRATVLEPLRALLSRDRATLERAWSIISDHHRDHPPALLLEERIAWLATAGGAQAGPRIEAELQTAVTALLRDGRSGIATWALRALPRMPPLAQGTAAAWILALGTARETGTRPAIGDRPPDDLLAFDMQEIMGGTNRVKIAVLRRGLELSIGDLPDHDAQWIDVPETNPRYVEIRQGDTRQLVAVPAGQTVTLQVGPGSITLRTADYRLYHLAGRPPVSIAVLFGRDGASLAQWLHTRLAISDEVVVRLQAVEDLPVGARPPDASTLGAELVVLFLSRRILAGNGDPIRSVVRASSPRQVIALIQGSFKAVQPYLSSLHLRAKVIGITDFANRTIWEAIAGSILDAAKTLLREGQESHQRGRGRQRPLQNDK